MCHAQGHCSLAGEGSIAHWLEVAPLCVDFVVDCNGNERFWAVPRQELREFTRINKAIIIKLTSIEVHVHVSRDVVHKQW